MGFKILLRDGGSDIVSIFASLIEELPYEIAHCEATTIDWCDEVITKGFVESVSPSIVVNFLPEDFVAIDPSYLQGMGLLVEICRTKRIPLIQISTYQVYGGDYRDKGILELDPPHPATDDGKRILALEKIVTGMHSHILLRVGWILDAPNRSILSRMLPALLAKSPPVVSDHKYGNPVSLNFIARTIIAIIQQVLCGAKNWGVFHLHSSDSCSEAEIADYLIRVLQKDLGLQTNIPTIATKEDERQFFEGCGNLKGRRCTNNFGVQMPTWRSGFKTLVKAWFDHHENNLKQKSIC